MAAGDVFTTEAGDILVPYSSIGGHFAIEFPTVEKAWREKLDGTRERVVYYGGEFGWMSDDERFEARQKHPRTAP